MYADHYLFDRGYDCCCGDQRLHWILGGGSSLLCDCHSTVWGIFFFPFFIAEAPRSISELQCDVDRTGVLLLEEEPEYSSAGGVHWEVRSIVSPVTHSVGS